MIHTPRTAWILASTVGLLLGLGGARADQAQGKPPPPPTGLPNPSVARSLPEIADPFGVRSSLAAKGVTLQITYTGETFGDFAGGERRGAIYEDQFNFVIDADLEKLFGWTGGSLHANVFNIDGTGGLTRDYVGNLLPVSSIEALPSVKLYEAWFEQKAFGGKVSLRLGQLGADTEFQVSKYAAIFINGTYTWSGLFSSDWPSGGPAYPLATPGARLKVSPSDQLTFLVGLYNGDPAGPGPGDPQRRDENGLSFRTQDPPLLIGEGQYSYTLDKGLGLKGTAKLGAWRHFGTFASTVFDSNGVPLVSPLSNGVPRPLEGDEGVYGLLDQMIYHVPNGDPGTGIGVFARAFASPADRNLVDFYLDGGVDFSGMIPGRPNDIIGAAFAYAHVSHDLSLIDEARGGPAVRDYEANLELTYQYQVVPGFIIQPDLQYIIHPGGGGPNPLSATGAPIPDAFAAGVRATITY